MGDPFRETQAAAYARDIRENKCLLCGSKAGGESMGLPFCSESCLASFSDGLLEHWQLDEEKQAATG